MRILSAEPTVFFVRVGDGLRQLLRLRVEHGCADARLSLSIRAEGLDERLPLPGLGAGEREHDVYLPDLRNPTQLWLGLWADEGLCDEKRIEWQPQKHWEVYLIQYSHHDLGYTDLPSSVLRDHAGFLDDALCYCEETQDWPEETKFRLLVEQAWSLVHFIETRPKEDVIRLIRAIKRGQIEVTALFANETTELCGHEELIRLLYPAFQLKRQYGIAITSAEHNDIPGMSWGLASVLAGAGIRYFSPGIPFLYYEHPVHPLWDEAAVLAADRPGAFWWQGIDGSRVLLWNDLHGGVEWHPSSYQQVCQELPQMLKSLDDHGYAYDMVSYMIRGGLSDNGPVLLRYAYLIKEWNSRWAYPRLIAAHNEQFLSEFERRWGGTLETLRGEVPGTDYTVGATSTPKETAVNRQNHDWLLTAEKLATLASIVTCYQYPKLTLDEAYRNALYYDEHAWGMWQPGGPAQDGCWSEKRAFAYKAAALAHDVMLKAANKIADEISYDEEGYHLTTFNALSWQRSDIVRAPVRPWQPCGNSMYWIEPTGASKGGILVSGTAIGRPIVEPPASLVREPFELVDVATRRAVPYQLSVLEDPQSACAWAAERAALGKVDARYLREIAFVAEGLPAAGYKSFRMVPCEQWPTFQVPCSAADRAVENPFYRLELDPRTGHVASLIDKELGRDLIDHQAPHRFAQLLGRWPETGHEQAALVSQAAVSEVGPVFAALRLKGSAPGCPSWTQEIILYNAVKRIDVNVRLLRDSTPMLELYLAFPFQIQAPRFRFEGTDTVIEPIRDQLPGSNTDYYATQHYVQVYNDEWGVVWTGVDAPMVELGGLWPGYLSSAHHGLPAPGYGHQFLGPGEIQEGHIYSMLMYSNFRTNFTNVYTGELLFRYSFTTGRGGCCPGQARRFGWNAANPPLTVWMSGPKPGSLPSCDSFCQLDTPNVMLLTLKRAEDGNGLILRLIETEGKEAETTATLPRVTILQAYATNLVEESQRLLPCTPHTVQLTLRPYAIATVRLVTRHDVSSG